MYREQNTLRKMNSELLNLSDTWQNSGHQINTEATSETMLSNQS